MNCTAELSRVVAVDEPPSRKDFEHLSNAVTKLTTTIENLPQMMAAIYLRQDVYERDQRLHERTHQEQSSDIKDLRGWQEWAIRIVVGAVLVALVGLLWTQGG